MEPDTKEGRTRLLGGSRGKGVDEPVNSPAVMRGEPHSARSPVAKPHPSLHTTLTPHPSSLCLACPSHHPVNHPFPVCLLQAESGVSTGRARWALSPDVFQHLAPCPACVQSSVMPVD